MLMQTTSGGIAAIANEKLLGRLPRQIKLTAKQSKFVAGVADGKSLVEAYRASYATQANDKVVSVSANELMRNPKINAALKTMVAQKTHESKHASTEAEAKLFLLEQLMETCRYCQDEALRIKALELLAASMGIAVSQAYHDAPGNRSKPQALSNLKSMI